MGDLLLIELKNASLDHLDNLFREATMGEVVNMRDFQTPAQIEKARQALEQHRAHEENAIMNEALFGIPCAGFVEVPKDYDPRAG